MLLVLTHHHLMLQRNLLHTIVSRVKRLVVLVGVRRAIAIAVKINCVNQRHTALDYRLRA